MSRTRLKLLCWMLLGVLLSCKGGDDDTNERMMFDAGVDAVPDPDFDSDAAPECPPTPPSNGAACAFDGSCTYEGEQSITCECTFTGWHCNSCPADFRSPDATCEPASTCEYEDWEHGCYCVCDESGHWQCEAQTVGSVCVDPA